MTENGKIPEDLLAEYVKSGLSGLSPLPSWDAIAKLVDLEGFRIGNHSIRDEDRYRVASFSVPRLWSVQVSPFQRPVWRLAGITAIGEEFRGKTTTDWIKAVLATHEDSAVLALDSDPVAHAIGALDLLDPSGFLTLDGVSYRVALQTRSLNAAFEFSNPTHGPLMTLERQILDLARTIALSSGKQALISRWSGA